MSPGTATSPPPPPPAVAPPPPLHDDVVAEERGVDVEECDVVAEERGAEIEGDARPLEPDEHATPHASTTVASSNACGRHRRTFDSRSMAATIGRSGSEQAPAKVSAT